MEEGTAEKKEEHEDSKKEKEEAVKPEVDVHVKKHHAKPAKKQLQIKMNKTSMWQAAAVILGILLVVSFTSNKCGDGVTGAVTAEEAGEKTVGFINTQLLDGQAEAVLAGVDEESSMYKVRFEVQGEEYPSYVTVDGKLLFLQQAINLDEDINTNEQQAAPEVTKSEKPEVELFVMSHCPYGTQIEKGMIPVAELLGDKIDFSVKFVYYAMHGKTELDEQLKQHCIQEEHNGKYIDYLICFLEEGDGEGCLAETGIGKAELQACIDKTDAEFRVTEQYENESTWLSGRFPLYDVDKALNEKYGVKGSPHLVINGDTASAGRDASSLLAAVCNSFTEQPEECSAELSSETPSPGFGFEYTEGSATGTCG